LQKINVAEVMIIDNKIEPKMAIHAGTDEAK
jgi:hypothetical protein